MKFQEAINHILKEAEAEYFYYNQDNSTIELKSFLTSGVIEQSQQIKIVERLEHYGVKFEILLDGKIKIL
mgnify:CR=1 FL=1